MHIGSGRPSRYKGERKLAFCPKCGAQVGEGAIFCQSCGSPLQNARPGFFVGPQQSISGLSTLSRDRTAQEYWMKRLLAYFIDAIIVYVVIGLVVAATVLPAYFIGLFIPGASARVLFGGFLGTLASLLLVLYFTFAETYYGRSIGKGIMGLHVTTDSGQRLTLGASFLRNLSKIYWVLLLLDVVVGLALEIGYLKKFSDRFLGTRVS